ncbi:MAG: hypothetical protein WKG00_22995 [Polyangiaceae bacterium]
MRPLGARWLGLALAFFTSGVVRRAWAQDGEVEGFFVASVGFTDNIDSRPPGIPATPTAPAVEGPQADGFIALSPSIAFVYTTPRAVYRSSYTFSTTLYFQNPEGNAVGNAVGLASRFETSDTTSLLLSLGAEQGQLNQVAVGEAASTRPVQFLSPGDNVYFRFTAGEGFELQASENVSVVQTLGASLYVPLDGQRVQTYDATLGVVRAFNYDSLGLTAGVGYANFEEFEEPVSGVVTTQTQQITTRLTGTWIHSYTGYLSHQLDAGVVMVMRANDGGGRLVQPVGRAALRYVRPEAAASIEYAHDATPNVFIGTNVLTDSVVARLLVPIVGTELAAEGSGGYSMAREINLDGDLGAPAHLWTGDVALLWSPAGVRGNLQMALRYQVVNQSSANANNPRLSQTQDFTRNTVLLSVTAAYPDIERGTAPASASPPFRTVPASSGFLEAPDPSAPVGPDSPDSPTGPRPPGVPGAAPSGD